MNRKVVNMVVVPLLFVAAAIPVSLFVADIATKEEPQVTETISEPKQEWILSPYDEMFKTVGAQFEVDWILLSAIADVESKFTPSAVSKAGATGIMQVMPQVAKAMGYEREQLLDERVCTEVAAHILHGNNKMLKFAPGFNDTERIKFVLACYNAGYSRIADARRLARFYEENHNNWSVVSTYLPLLAEPEYAEHEVVRSGAFYGSSQTIAYVKSVMRIYDRYKRRVAEAIATQPKSDENS